MYDGVKTKQNSRCTYQRIQSVLIDIKSSHRASQMSNTPEEAFADELSTKEKADEENQSKQIRPFEMFT